MDTDTLHTLVSSAIWRAEQLEDRGLGSAALAWAEVSQLEEQLAGVFPLTEPEGKIARRGAVRAALKAGDYARAHMLVRRFTGEDGTPRALKTALRGMLEDDAGSLAGRYPYAAKRHRIEEARDQAVFLREAGPFGLAKVA